MARICGYAVRWDDTADLGDHSERIQRGAFRHMISTSLRCCHDTRPGAVLAWAMPVAEDSTGLFFCAPLDPVNADHRRAIAAMRDGMDAVSFVFRPSKTRWEGDCEVVEQAQLKEISLLGQGAYPGSKAWLVE